MYCRFENRIDHTALELSDLAHKIYAYHLAELPAVWQQIQAAQQQGYWVGLVANYELGAHLLQANWARPSTTPLLSAYIMRQAHQCQPWGAPT